MDVPQKPWVHSISGYYGPLTMHYKAEGVLQYVGGRGLED